ncbi:hypothetical protein [Streptomyces sp. HNM0574]|uniref:hypothetical protein n=1 Tax=Streptomyces sp. HNM0574 TaxID=2714954 RepID=UPI00146CACEE|nr:hypothetical protein [Streptomyces sp. HNM0574]NLU67342.1 hypothetical protein [Streptomyces sp. HNM0574]
MRLRHAVAVTAGAFALALSLPASASAATGDFLYEVPGQGVAALTDPPSGQCVTLPEVSDPRATPPAHSTRNHTDAQATVFKDANCQGPSFKHRAHGGYGSERLEVRSVWFS